MPDIPRDGGEARENEPCDVGSQQSAHGTATEIGPKIPSKSVRGSDWRGKPFHFPELVLRIRSLARRKPAARSRILRTAGIELDALTRTATRDGRLLELLVLSTKEFAVLEALLKTSPGALSAETLLEQAWGENADPFNRAGSRFSDGRPAPPLAARCCGPRVPDPRSPPDR